MDSFGSSTSNNGGSGGGDSYSSSRSGGDSGSSGSSRDYRSHRDRDRNDRDRDRNDRDRDRGSDRDRDRGSDRDRDRGSDRDRDSYRERRGGGDYSSSSRDYKDSSRKRSRSPHRRNDYQQPQQQPQQQQQHNIQQNIQQQQQQINQQQHSNQSGNNFVTSSSSSNNTSNSRKSMWDRAPEANEIQQSNLVGQVFFSAVLAEQHPKYQQQLQQQQQQQISQIQQNNLQQQFQQQFQLQQPAFLPQATGGGMIPQATLIMPSSAPNQSKQSRRLYIGNIPPNTTDMVLVDFFNTAITAANLYNRPGTVVVGAQINIPKNFAFLEFRSAEEATRAMSLDGISLHSYSLKIRRPKDYQGPANGESDSTGNAQVSLSIVSTNVPDSEDKIFIGGIPSTLNEEQVKNMLMACGRLRAFNLVKDSRTGVSKGFAFCEFYDKDETDKAIEDLHGTKFGDKHLIVQRASIGSKDTTQKRVGGSIVNVDPSISSMLNLTLPVPQVLGSIRSNIPSDNNTKVSKVVQLFNMIDQEEIQDDKDYENLLIDIREECEQFGAIDSIFVSRPKESNPLDVVKVFVKFVQTESAQQAWMALGGRRYNYRTIITAFFPEDLYIIQGNQDFDDVENMDES